MRRYLAILLASSVCALAETEEALVERAVTDALASLSYFQCKIEKDAHGDAACVNVRHLIAPKDNGWKSYSPIPEYLGHSVIVRLYAGGESVSLVTDDKVCIGTANDGKLIFCPIGKISAAIAERNHRTAAVIATAVVVMLRAVLLR